jgi:hypothetical protein
VHSGGLTRLAVDLEALLSEREGQTGPETSSRSSYSQGLIAREGCVHYMSVATASDAPALQLAESSNMEESLQSCTS